jgi:hypothetical protein
LGFEDRVATVRALDPTARADAAAALGALRKAGHISNFF